MPHDISSGGCPLSGCDRRRPRLQAPRRRPRIATLDRIAEGASLVPLAGKSNACHLAQQPHSREHARFPAAAKARRDFKTAGPAERAERDRARDGLRVPGSVDDSELNDGQPESVTAYVVLRYPITLTTNTARTGAQHDKARERARRCALAGLCLRRPSPGHLAPHRTPRTTHCFATNHSAFARCGIAVKTRHGAILVVIGPD